MREAVIDFFDVNEAWLRRVLDRGVAERKLVLSGSSAEAAQAIVSGLEGAMLIARPYDDIRRFDTAASQLLTSLVRSASATVPNR
jgi:TetR/AcrR family transcriptional repressor of nem operon